MSAFDALMTFERETRALEQVAGRLGWDQETMMPPGAKDQRAEEMGAMQAAIHARRTDPRLADWLAAAEAEDEVGQAQLRHMRRDHARATRVPVALAVELARVTSTAQGIWAAARKDDDFSAFAPVLETVLALKREQAAALAEGGISMMLCWRIMSHRPRRGRSKRSSRPCAPGLWRSGSGRSRIRPARG